LVGLKEKNIRSFGTGHHSILLTGSLQKQISMLLVSIGVTLVVFFCESHEVSFRITRYMSINLSSASHDIDVAAWGPFNKCHAGAGHIPDTSGRLFNLCPMPTLFRRKAEAPSLRWESGHHPWEASGDLGYWKSRHELIWKDRLFCDIEYGVLDPSRLLIRCEVVNDSDAPENLALHWMASMSPPPRGPGNAGKLQAVRADLPEGGLWVDAMSYTDLAFRAPRIRDGLEWAGALKGEEPVDGFVGGFGLGREFGTAPGDRVNFQVHVPADLPAATLVLRGLSSGRSAWRLEGFISERITFNDSAQPFEHRLALGALSGGCHHLELTCLETEGSLKLDGFAIFPAGGSISFPSIDWQAEPVVSSPQPRALLLEYPESASVYGLAWDGKEAFCLRTLVTDDLDGLLRETSHDHVSERIVRGGTQPYTNVFLRPLTLVPGERKIIRAIAVSGEKEEVEAALRWFHEQSSDALDEHMAIRRKTACRPLSLPAGTKHLESQTRMMATTLTNIVYPTRIKGQWNRHFCPGKWWDSPYTWDSGMIALGLAQIDTRRALECVNAYLTEPGDPDAAFIHWGSPVPTQFYAFQEIWSLGAISDARAATLFPRLRHYHRFLVGRADGSRMRMPSGLLRTFDYFYNSGGWDDYPPQVFVHREGLADRTSPAGNTAHAIRCAKILCQLAESLNEDTTEFEQDIAELTDALSRHSWDPDAGVFSYVVHDSSGRPKSFLRDPAGGGNFNLGMDGLLPLIAGTCSEEQEAALLDRLLSPEHCATPIGLSAVDQSAPYYRRDGYWNGSVWMPHQWFFWKSLLDLGRADDAWRIASTALDLWTTEVSRTYNCFEHFLIETGRGAGWHCFSGLSTPVLAWFRAYFTPGSLQTGFDGVVVSRRNDPEAGTLEATIRFTPRRHATPRTVIAVVPETFLPHVLLNGQPAETSHRFAGCIEITVPPDLESVTLEIIKKA
jgi:hypothetical protein